MLQTAFLPSCMNQASVFEWHKRFKEGRESVRDDKRGGRNKEVNTPELIGQIKDFMDKDRRRSIETISAQFDVSVGTVHRIIREELKMRKICAKFVPRVLREDQKERRCHDSREMVELINSDPAVLDAHGDLRWKLDLLLWPRDQETEFPVKACWLSQTQEGQTEQIHPQTFDDPFFYSTGMIYMHWIPTGQTVNKKYYVEVLREFRKRFRRKRPALFKSGQLHFHQDNARVHYSILVTDYLTKMGIKTVPHPPYSPDLVPVTFGYSLSSRKNLEAVIMRQLRRWKRLWRRSLTRWHKRTSIGPSRSCWKGTTSALQPEIISKGTRVSCVYYQ